jgi:hypothetical protein
MAKKSLGALSKLLLTLVDIPGCIEDLPDVLTLAKKRKSVGSKRSCTRLMKFSLNYSGVFCRPDQCSLTNSYVDNNSSLISE